MFIFTCKGAGCVARSDPRTAMMLLMSPSGFMAMVTLEEPCRTMRVQVRNRLGSHENTRGHRNWFAGRYEGGIFGEIGEFIVFTIVMVIFCVIVILFSIDFDGGEGVGVRGSRAWTGIRGRWE